MAAPTLTSYAQSTWTDAPSPPTTETTGTLSWNSGDTIYVVGVLEDNKLSLSTPTATGLTFTLQVGPTSGTDVCKAYLWTATAGSSGSGTISSTLSRDSGTDNNVAGGLSAWAYNGQGLGATATISGSSAITISLTRGSANSAVAIGMGDWNQGGDVTVTSVPSTGATQRVTVANSGNADFFVLDWGDQGATGTTSYGIGSHTGTAKMSGIVFEIKGTAASGVTATASLTQAANTLSAAATTPVTASATPTQAANTLAATASTPVTAALSANQAADTLSADASVTSLTASLDAAQDDNTLDATAATAVQADADLTQAGDSLSAAAVTPVTAAADLNQDGDTLSASASVGSGVTASAALTQEDDSLAADAVTPVTADAALNSDGDTLSADATTPITAALDASQDGDTLSASAATAVTADLDAAQAPDSLTADATVESPAPVTGDLSIVQEDNSIAATANVGGTAGDGPRRRGRAGPSVDEIVTIELPTAERRVVLRMPQVVVEVDQVQEALALPELPHPSIAAAVAQIAAPPPTPQLIRLPDLRRRLVSDHEALEIVARAALGQELSAEDRRLLREFIKRRGAA